MEYKSDYKLYDGIEVLAQQALDKRTIVNTKSDLTKLDTWPHDPASHTVYMKEGMVVTVRETGDLNVLMSLPDILSEKGWRFYGSGGGSGMGDLDGGRAEESYTPSQIINCGGANAFGDVESK